MRDLAELNINEDGQPVNRPKPTDRDIAAFESHIGHRLPKAYVQLLRFANGGHPELDSFTPKGEDERSTWGVDFFYRLGPDRSDIEGLWKAVRDWKTVLGTSRLPIACDGCGNQIMLNLAKWPATVELCIHDEDFRIIPIADNFEEFIALLSIDPDMI